jgi:hypothetical protein
MGQQETPVEEYLVDEVKKAGGKTRKLQWIGRVGAPDRLVWWVFPHVAMVEVKGTRKSPYEASQVREMARLHEDGWPVYTVRSKADVDTFIATMKRRLHSDLI